MLKTSLTLVTAISLLSWGTAAWAADVAAGEAKADEACADCHEPGDWEGENAASIAAMIKAVVAGEVKHKGKLNLTDTEIANIAAYWSAASD
jgi:cytochrome c553